MVAQAYLQLERFEEAEKDATAVLRFDPGNSKAIYRRGRARLGRPQPDMEAGCADLARIVSENPKNKEARHQLVYCECNGRSGPTACVVSPHICSINSTS